MPLQVPGKTNQRQTLRAWTGVNLRIDPQDLSPEQLVKGVNIDLYTKPGVIRVRRGFTSYATALATGARSFMLSTSEGYLFHTSGQKLYRDDSITISNSILLNAANPVYMSEYKGLQALNPQIFIANGFDPDSDPVMYRYDRASGLGNWGVIPPTTAPTIAAGTGTLVGDYNAVYTYARYIGSQLVSESNPSSAPSAAVTLATEGLDVTVAASAEADVTHIRVYRTQAGGSTYLFDTLADNTAATITLTQADGALGAAVSQDNDRPTAATLIHILRDRVWLNDLTVDNRLRYSTKFYPEYFPANNYIDLGGVSDVITAIVSINNALVVFTRDTKYRVLEADPNVVAISGDLPFIGSAAADFIPLELPSSRGTNAPYAVKSTSFGIIYPSREGLFITQGDTSPEQMVSDKFQSIFIGETRNGIPPIDFNYESNMVAAWYQGKYYLSYTSTHSADGENDYTVVVDLVNQSHWFWDSGFSFFSVNTDESRFYGGYDDPPIYRIEEPGVYGDDGAAVAATIETAHLSPIDDLVRSLFLYTRVDADVAMNDTLTASFYADGTLKHTETITGSRTKSLIRLPAKSRGFTWHMSMSFSGTGLLEIHGVEAQFKPLMPS